MLNSNREKSTRRSKENASQEGRVSTVENSGPSPLQGSAQAAGASEASKRGRRPALSELEISNLTHQQLERCKNHRKKQKRSEIGQSD